jgi:hypothetical protein
MAERITQGAAVQRAWHDTTYVFNVQERPRLFVRVALALAMVGAGALLVGKARVTQDLSGVASFLVAFGGVFTLWFLFNLWWAPARIANEKMTRLEERERTAPDAHLSTDRYDLVVVNAGAPADFHAQLVVIGSENWAIPEGKSYEALWERSQKNRAYLFSGQPDRILIGSFAPTAGQPPGALLTLHYFDLNVQNRHNVSTDYLLLEGQPHPSLRLKVSIFSKPELRRPVVREVELRPDGLHLLDRVDEAS